MIYSVPPTLFVYPSYTILIFLFFNISSNELICGYIAIPSSTSLIIISEILSFFISSINLLFFLLSFKTDITLFILSLARIQSETSTISLLFFL